MISKVIKKILPSGVRKNIKRYILSAVYGPGVPGSTFSVCGEDNIINYLFFFKTSGFYIDIGAFHPVEFSNTFLLYQNGWSGINIDARPGVMAPFNKIRSRDINLEIGISEDAGEQVMYLVDDGQSSMNSFSKPFLEKLNIASERIKPVAIKTTTLEQVLDQHKPLSNTIDLLLIDVEGYEINVLRSNNWEKYRPILIMLENHLELTSDVFKSDVTQLMNNVGYRLISKTPNENIFLENSYKLHPTGTIEKFMTRPSKS